MRRGFFSIAIAALVITACTDGKVYDHYNHTPLAGWDKVDTLVFNVPPVPAAGHYSTDLGLRLNNTFPFVSLTLIVEQTVIPGGYTRTDTVSCKLINEKGKINRHGVSYYQYSYHVSQMQLHARDSLHITVRHDMMREILPGISDVGIQLGKY
ncbi:MAG: gliding motility lipoprotein GldH [Prevotella sp.]|nr:gliding motility lipoprotein GldH [Prevotella sp.]